MPPVITLLTDFGIQDEYTGVVRGVILSRVPSAVIVDITHHIRPQDIREAAHMLHVAYRYFPDNTVHMAVVDPGVGSERGIIAVRAGKFRFLAPDNGLLSLVLDELPVEEAVRVENTDFFLPSVSRTFHGRDIFAPVAAAMAKGLDLKNLGPETGLSELVRIDAARPVVTDAGELTGIVVSVDRFGNLITNIRQQDMDRLGSGKLKIHVGTMRIAGIAQSYANAGTGCPLAIMGSRDCLEIAVNCGNAQKFFGLEKGAVVRVKKLQN